MCLLINREGGGEFFDHPSAWWLRRKYPAPRSYLKDRIMLPVFMLEILVFLSKEVRFITSSYYLIRLKQCPVLDVAEANSDFTASFDLFTGGPTLLIWFVLI
jgi:hypothetical protein